MADNFLSRLLESLSPNSSQFPENLEKDATAKSRESGQDLELARQELINNQKQKLNQPLPSDGDLVRNILMKGVLPPSNTPNFSDNKDPMWFSPQGPIRPNQMPPSPLKPEIQEQMMADAIQQNLMPNKPIPSPEPMMKSMASKAPAPAMPKAPPKPEIKLPEAPQAPAAPKVDEQEDMLKKLLASAGDDSELRKAMEEQQQRETIAMMMRGVANIGAGMSGQNIKTDPDYMKDYVEAGKNKVSNIEKLQKGKQEKIKFALDTEKGMLDLTKAKLGFADEKMARDPGSKTSQLARESMRDALNRIGKKDLASKIGEDMSARQLEDRFGEFNIQNMVTAYEGQQNRLAMEKERSAARKDALAAKQDDKKDANVMSLRKELTAGNVGKVHANYLNAERNERIIADFAKNPTGYSDYGTLMGSLKTLQGDESVVREAEIKLGQQAGTLSQTIQNMIDSKIKGTSLQPKQRQAILTAVGILKNRARQQYQEVIEPVLQQADKMGIERAELLPKNMQEKELNKTSPFDTDAAKAELEKRKKGNK